MLKVKWKSCKSLYLREEITSGPGWEFRFLSATNTPRQPVPPHSGQAAAAPAGRSRSAEQSGPLLPRRSPWTVGAVGSSGTYSSQLYRGHRVWAVLGCWAPSRVTIKRSLVSASFLGTKSIIKPRFLKGK